jgi:hypothetical protein
MQHAAMMIRKWIAAGLCFIISIIENQERKYSQRERFLAYRSVRTDTISVQMTQGPTPMPAAITLSLNRPAGRKKHPAPKRTIAADQNIS